MDATKILCSMTFALCLIHAQAQEWQVVDEVTHDASGFTDGDSIPVVVGEESFIINLYYIDAPEVSARYPDKANEQAEYFGQSVDDLTAAGKKAGEFVTAALANGFVVHTRYSKIAGGGGPRYYGMIKVGDRWLSELLVENGWARVKGRTHDLPDGTGVDDFRLILNTLETQASEAKVGAWSESVAEAVVEVDVPAAAPPEQIAEGVMTLPGEVLAYSVDGEFKPLGKLKEGWKIKIVDAEPYVRVIVAVPGKGPMPVLIKASDLTSSP